MLSDSSLFTLRSSLLKALEECFGNIERTFCHLSPKVEILLRHKARIDA